MQPPCGQLPVLEKEQKMSKISGSTKEQGKELSRIAKELMPLDESGEAEKAYKKLAQAGVLTTEEAFEKLLDEIRMILHPIVLSINDLQLKSEELSLEQTKMKELSAYQGGRINSIEASQERERNAGRTLSIAYIVAFLISVLAGLWAYSSRATPELPIQVGEEHVVITGFQIWPQAYGVFIGAIVFIVLVMLIYFIFAFSMRSNKVSVGNFQQTSETQILPAATGKPPVRQSIMTQRGDQK